MEAEDEDDDTFSLEKIRLLPVTMNVPQGIVEFTFMLRGVHAGPVSTSSKGRKGNERKVEVGEQGSV